MKRIDCACGENHEGWVPISGPDLSRRRFFRIVGTGVTGYYLTRVTRPLEVLAQTKPPLLNTALNCIFIFLAGAPSHIDTFDLKEGSWTPTNFAPTTVSGIRLPTGISADR